MAASALKVRVEKVKRFIQTFLGTLFSNYRILTRSISYGQSREGNEGMQNHYLVERLLLIKEDSTSSIDTNKTLYSYKNDQKGMKSRESSSKVQ